MKIVLKNFLTFNYFYNNFFLTALMLLISKNQFQKQHKMTPQEILSELQKLIHLVNIHS